MARYLFAWELGGNYGHLGRCAPVARALREHGHQVLFAVRDLRIAAEQLGREGLRYVQAPVWGRCANLPHPPANYAELLLAEGYGDAASLWGALQGWVGLMQLYRPDVLIVDHAPTALLARRIIGMPAVVVGTGFEIPPVTEPMPSIRPWETVPEERLRASERAVMHAIDRALQSFGSQPLGRLGALFEVEQRILATFAELDHYGHRPTADYIGASFGSVQGPPTTWERKAPRIFVYLRPATFGFERVFSALVRTDVELICVAPGLSDNRLSREGMRLSTRPINLEHIVTGAQLAVTNAGAGMTAQFLLAGVPLVLLPEVVEQGLTARRAAALGAAIVLDSGRSETQCAQALADGLHEPRYRDRAREFAAKYRGFTPERVSAYVTQAALAVAC